jgi:protein ImuB
MRRVISLWLPTFPIDRLRRHADVPPDGPLITSAHDGRRLSVAAADAAAAALGLYPGMPLAQAQAQVPGLAIHPAEPEADAEALRRLAAWCLRYTPLVAPAAPDGVWLDVTGCAHLHGGETRLLRDLIVRCEAQGLAARAAIADTPGAAHAIARHEPSSRKAGEGRVRVVPIGITKSALAPLPIASLRLPPDTLESLRLLGFERVEQLATVPRAPLTRRFGPLVANRLDQALGTIFEPIVPLVPPDLPQARLTFIEPLLTAEAFAAANATLVHTICAVLEKTGQGARRLDLVFHRVDGSVQPLRIGTARPSRDARHLARLLDEKLERIDPGLGIEAMHLIAVLIDRLPHTQTEAMLPGTEDTGTDVSTLVDRLENRLGSRRVWRAAPVESDVPERSVRHVPAVAPPRRTAWPADLPRPVRLLDPPQPVDAMALLPDQPPVAFTWRRVRHRVRRADGPERIAGEWWKRAGEMRSVRDYFRVEDEAGQRFWLFRRGDGDDPATGDLRWFLHGFF